MMEPSNAGPKLFVSYSWTSPEHEAWVLNLATELRGYGIDVILDKWDLKEGHDAHLFMEQMVTNPEVKKVILVCDKKYVDKTDGRDGGVGTEAQIISAEIYGKQAQDKFVAIVAERDEDGKPYLPAYYRSRIYIDLSDAGSFSDNFEKLLRWAYDRRLNQKPELGTRPEFLDSKHDETAAVATVPRLKRAIDALRDGRENALPAAAQYLEMLVLEFEKMRIDSEAGPFDDAVWDSIGSFLPYRNQFIELIVTLASYKDTLASRTILHRFFEQVIPFTDRPPDVRRYRETDWDNFKFIVYELFLYAIAILIRESRFESAAYLMDNQYYVSGRPANGHADVMVSYDIFHQFVRSLDIRNKRLQLGRLSLSADLLKERCKGVNVEFRQLMQADFILFLRSSLERPNAFVHWIPDSLVWSHSGPFEIFARSRSKVYFERAKVLLGIQDKEALTALVQSFDGYPNRIPRWDFDSFSPAYLLGLNELATRP